MLKLHFDFIKNPLFLLTISSKIGMLRSICCLYIQPQVHCKPLLDSELNGTNVIGHLFYRKQVFGRKFAYLKCCVRKFFVVLIEMGMPKVLPNFQS